MELEKKINQNLEDLCSGENVEIHGKKFKILLTYLDFIDYSTLLQDFRIDKFLSFLSRFSLDHTENSIADTTYQEVGDIINFFYVKIDQHLNKLTFIQQEFEIQLYKKSFSTPYFNYIFSKYFFNRNTNSPIVVEELKLIEFLLLKKLLTQ